MTKIPYGMNMEPMEIAIIQNPFGTNMEHTVTSIIPIRLGMLTALTHPLWLTKKAIFMATLL